MNHRSTLVTDRRHVRWVCGSRDGAAAAATPAARFALAPARRSEEGRGGRLDLVPRNSWLRGMRGWWGLHGAGRVGACPGRG